MVNKEHLEILRQAEVWNRWRREYAEERPLLRGAYLISADLRGANLSEANLWEAVLISADLRGDLSVAKGLDTVEHSGPSTVGIDPLQIQGQDPRRLPAWLGRS